MNKILSQVLKCIVAVSALLGIALSIYDGRNFMGGWNVFLYFTVQSNLWIAILDIVALVLLWKGTSQRTGSQLGSQAACPCSSRTYSLAQLIFTVSITLTGVVFCFVLAPTMPDGTAFVPANVLTHVIVPLAAVIDFIVCRKQYTFRWLDSLYSTIPAWYYLAFASIGYVLNWPFSAGANYPYFFLNWGSEAGVWGTSNALPFIGVGYYILIILAFLIALATCYIALCPRKK